MHDGNEAIRTGAPAATKSGILDGLLGPDYASLDPAEALKQLDPGITLLQIAGLKTVPHGANQIRLQNLHLDTRPEKALRREGILYVGELLPLSIERVGHVKNMGAKSLWNIVTKIDTYFESESSLSVDPPNPREGGEVGVDGPTLAIPWTRVANKPLSCRIEWMAIHLRNRVEELLEDCVTDFTHRWLPLTRFHGAGHSQEPGAPEDEPERVIGDVLPMTLRELLDEPGATVDSVSDLLRLISGFCATREADVVDTAGGVLMPGRAGILTDQLVREGGPRILDWLRGPLAVVCRAGMLAEERREVPISLIGLAPECAYALEHAGIRSVGQLLEVTIRDLRVMAGRDEVGAWAILTALYRHAARELVVAGSPAMLTGD